jgi:hypothetical protein
VRPILVLVLASGTESLRRVVHVVKSAQAISTGFQRTPQLHNENTIDPAVFAVHRGPNTVRLELARAFRASKLRLLIGVENRRAAVFFNCLIEHLNTRTGPRRIRQLPRQHVARASIHDGHEILRVTRHRNIHHIRTRLNSLSGYGR